MSNADFIDDRGEAGPVDNAEWLRWAAETYASAVAKGGCYAPEPDWDVSAVSPGLHGAAAEIERLRARVEVLHDALSATHTWLGAALKCPAFQWDADQKQAAQHDYDEARAALEAKP